MKYTIQYFIDKFTAIPENQWAMYTFKDSTGAHCAQGHCMKQEELDRLVPDKITYELLLQMIAENSEWKSLIDIFQKKTMREGIAIASINNGDDHAYQQSTPKERVLAALYDKLAEENLDKHLANVAKEMSEKYQVTKRGCPVTISGTLVAESIDFLELSLN